MESTYRTEAFAPQQVYVAPSDQRGLDSADAEPGRRGPAMSEKPRVWRNWRIERAGFRLHVDFWGHPDPSSCSKVNYIHTTYLERDTSDKGSEMF